MSWEGKQMKLFQLQIIQEYLAESHDPLWWVAENERIRRYGKTTQQVYSGGW